jgi:hypothetical protein
MKKVIRLTESDLIRIVKQIIKENDKEPKSQYGEYTAEEAMTEIDSYINMVGCSEGKSRLLNDLSRMVDEAQRELSEEEFNKLMDYVDGLEQEIHDTCSEDDSDEDDDFYHGGEGPGGRW